MQSLVISRKIYERMVNILYWKRHYASITNISRLFSDIKKHGHEHQICLRCLGHFQTEETLARQKQLCTLDDFLSVLHVLPTPGSKQEQIKFNQYKFCTKAPFVICADFESILKPSGRQVKQTIYTQQHKVCAAAVIPISSYYNFDKRTVIKVIENALAAFLNTLIVWEAEIVAILWTNRAMKRLSSSQQEEYDNATRCYICRHEFVEGEANDPKPPV